MHNTVIQTDTGHTYPASDLTNLCEMLQLAVPPLMSAASVPWQQNSAMFLTLLPIAVSAHLCYVPALLPS